MHSNIETSFVRKVLLIKRVLIFVFVVKVFPDFFELKKLIMADKIDNNPEMSVVKVTEASLLPHLESLERMMKLPVIEAAWTQSQGVYDKMRGKNRWKFIQIDMIVREISRRDGNKIEKVHFHCMPCDYVACNQERISKNFVKLSWLCESDRVTQYSAD